MADDTTNPPASPFSEEQLAAIKQTVGGMMNSAFRQHLQQADKKRAEDIDKVKGEFGKLLDEKLTGLKSPADEGDKGKGGGKASSAIEIATLQRQIEELRAKSDASEKKAAELEAKNLATVQQQRTRDHLSAQGIDGARFTGAYALLQHQGRIKGRDDDPNEFVFVDDTGQEVDLKVGLDGWLKTEDAKIYLPPKGTTGAGSRPGSIGSPATKPTRTQAEEQAWASAGEALRSAFGGTSGSF